MSEKSIIIIGAGLSGLLAGYYCQLNGYKTNIFRTADNTDSMP
ncbi:MAG: NAD(P)-binding protein [Planctomycetota bacterium]